MIERVPPADDDPRPGQDAGNEALMEEAAEILVDDAKSRALLRRHGLPVLIGSGTRSLEIDRGNRRGVSPAQALADAARQRVQRRMLSESEHRRMRVEHPLDQRRTAPREANDEDTRFVRPAQRGESLNELSRERRPDLFEEAIPRMEVSRRPEHGIGALGRSKRFAVRAGTLEHTCEREEQVPRGSRLAKAGRRRAATDDDRFGTSAALGHGLRQQECGAGVRRLLCQDSVAVPLDGGIVLPPERRERGRQGVILERTRHRCAQRTRRLDTLRRVCRRC